MFSLCIGTGIYWLFRGIAIVDVRPFIPLPRHNWLASVILYNLPDGLWLYALLTGLRLVWKEHLFSRGLAWLMAVICGSVGSEIAQHFHLIPGTFDLLDIGAYLVFSLLFILRYRVFITHHKPLSV